MPGESQGQRSELCSPSEGSGNLLHTGNNSWTGGKKGDHSCPAVPQRAQGILCQAGTSEYQLGPL